jgi:beta-glucanase (GH16 family)
MPNVTPPVSTKTVFDDFAGPAWSKPNSALWAFDKGYGWPNGERQTYTDSTDNVFLDGHGHLIIRAVQDRRAQGGYTSGRIKTQGKLNMGYGLTEAMIQMPSGRGTLAAFWMLGSDYDAVGWPACGEIDIVEFVNLGTEQGFPAHMTLHGPQEGEEDYRLAGAGEYAGLTAVEDTGFDPSAGFHRYWCRRSPDSITLGIDETIQVRYTPSDLPPGAAWVFNDRPAFAILSLAVGGGWAGNPDSHSHFPKEMVVDWFRYTP